MEPMYKNVPSLPDLIDYRDLERYPTEKVFKFRITVQEGQISILGDSPYPEDLEKILRALGCAEIEYVLCG